MSPAAGAQPSLRVAFVVDRWQPERGGAERALTQLAAHLLARGHEVHAFALRGPGAGEEAPGALHLIPPRGLGRAARERRFAADALAAAGAAGCELTVGIRHLPRVDLYWPHGGAHAETLTLLGKRPRGRHRAFLALERELLERGGARRVVCVSERVREELARHYPACAPRLRTIPNGLDLARFEPGAQAEAARALRARFAAPPRGPVLGFAGRNAWLKGLDVLLEALAGLPELDWALAVGGPRRLGPWRRRAARLGLDPARLLFASELPPLELAAGAELALVPTRRDTSSLALLEALACGRPVLASARAGAADRVGEGAGEVLPAGAGAEGWRAALARWVPAVAAGEVDPARARACVRGLGLEDWLRALEAQLLELAAERSIP